MDELRFRGQQPRNDAPMGSFVSPPRNGTRLSQPSDPRSSLPRRFTAESGRVPTLSTINSQRAPEPQDLSATTALHKVQLLEKKRLEYEKLREQKRRFEAEMQKLDQQQRLDEQELAAMTEDLGRIGVSATQPSNPMTSGHQSEPTTPPELRDTTSGFPSMFSRPNRYSTSSLTSPPGLLFNRPGRSGSQIASPQSGMMQASQQRFSYDDQQQPPSRSVPGSRRNSDEDEKEEAVRQDPTSHRSTNALNRYSMPVTRSKTGFYDFSSLDQTNTTRFLFGEEEDHGNGEVKFFQTSNPAAVGRDESFPILTRREGQPHMLSASSTALDLALSQMANVEANNANGWGNINRHRTQPSLSQLNGGTPVTSGQTSSDSISALPASIRHSFDMKYFKDSTSDASVASIMSSPPSQILATPPKLQSSYSANDISALKSTPGSAVSSTNNHAQQYLHNHNASLGRIPAGAVPNRHSRDLSTTGDMNGAMSARNSIGSTLQANAAPFGQTNGTNQVPPSISAGTLAAAAAAAASTSAVTTMPPTSVGNHFMAGYYGGPNYNIPGAATATAPGGAPYGANGLPMLHAMSLNGANPMYQPHGFNGYGGMYGVSGNQSQIRDSQARVIQSRRQMDNEAMNRYNNTPLESVGGTIYELCKDQHGCRYLQKQLENRNPEQVHMIWLETNQHVVELMTDPFGNYLCQKLLEYCNDDERTVLIQNAAQDMVRIALNQHGTRALQKMIEFISTDAQVQIIIDALRHRVVELIQDLNGNHVIQKCLNKLTPANAQFIFDAVGGACVEVGTHRHGCCVLQRCIDHASGDQKVWLIQRITDEAVTLVQDPFGNYVVQYIIDLNDHNFTEPLVAQFRGRICALSRHKFSSNVVEKCLRCSLDPSKDLIVEELLVPGEIERLLRDSFANYVIQTALEYATPYNKVRLVDSIRPFLPQIRSTPYGRRIQAKIQAYESRSGQSSGHITPAESTQGQIPLHANHNRNSTSGMLVPTSAFSTNGVNGLSHRGAAGTSMAGGAVSQTATAGGPSGRPIVGQYGPPPPFARPGMPANGIPTTVAVIPTTMPVSMPPSMAVNMGMQPENGETAWL